MDPSATTAFGSKFASIDIGSHTIRLLIADLNENRKIVPLQIERRITRLAKDFQDGLTLKPETMATSLEALREYASILDRFGVHPAACGATGVMRRAKNSGDFLKAIKDETGIDASILSESSEALLSAKGCLSVLPKAKEKIVSFDLGGSSTEFLLADPERKEPLWSTSVFIGAATLTERFLKDDPVLPGRLFEAYKAVRQAILPTINEIASIVRADDPANPFPLQLVGTAGTVTTLAAMYLEMETYEPYRVNGLVLSEEWLTRTIDLLAGLSLASRKGLAGLEEGREDIILGGALIVREILKGMGKTRFTVTDGGLLEGLLLDRIEKECGFEPSLISPLTWQLQKG